MTKARTGKDGWREGKGQVEIDGNKDADFGKGRKNSWDVEPRSATEYGARGDGVRRVDNVKPGRGITDDEGVGNLRNKMPSDQSGGVGTKDIYDNVCENSDNASKTGGVGPIKYGVK